MSFSVSVIGVFAMRLQCLQTLMFYSFELSCWCLHTLHVMQKQGNAIRRVSGCSNQVPVVMKNRVHPKSSLCLRSLETLIKLQQYGQDGYSYGWLATSYSIAGDTLISNSALLPCN